MKIGSQRDAASAISTANAETIVIRGADLCRDLIGAVTLTEHFWLLVTGARPTAVQTRILDACLVAIAEHGLVPSVQAARMTLAAGPDAMQGAVAAGILGCGSVILGSAENAGKFLATLCERSSAVGMLGAANEIVDRYRTNRMPFPGYGHPLHKGGDPRVDRLLAVATEVHTSGRHVEAARVAEQAIFATTGKHLILNISGAIPAVLLDAGFPLAAMKGVPILARTASLVAHLVEEQARGIGFVLSEHAAKGIAYDGAAPSGFVAADGH